MENIRLWVFVTVLVAIFISLSIFLSIVQENIASQRRMLWANNTNIISTENGFYYASNDPDGKLIKTDKEGKPIWAFHLLSEWDRIEDFTVINNTVYIVSYKSLYILDENGIIKERILLKDLTNTSNQSEFYPVEIWNYRDSAYLYVHGNIYKFNGKILVSKTQAHISSPPIDKIKFGNDTIFVYRNNESIEFIEMRGSMMIWNLTSLEPYYYVNYPFLILYSSGSVSVYRNGAKLRNINFERGFYMTGVCAWKNKILMGIVELHDKNHVIHFEMYNKLGKNILNFMLNISPLYISSYDSPMPLYPSGNSIFMVYCNWRYYTHTYYMLKFQYPSKNGSVVHPSIYYRLSLSGGSIRFIYHRGNQFWIATFNGDDWDVGIYELQTVIYLDPYLNMGYKILLFIFLSIIFIGGIRWIEIR